MGDYRVILADPPWAYNVHSDREIPSGRSQMRGMKRGIAERHYAVATAPDMYSWPVQSLADDNAALFMWATMPQLPEAFQFMTAWGFEYKTVAFIWVKVQRNGEPVNHGLGHYTRSNAELCLLGIRGGLPRKARDVAQVIMSRRREHSRKPDEQYDRIMRLFDGPYLELFGRQRWPGWDTWGNQTDLFPAQPFLIPEAVAS